MRTFLKAAGIELVNLVFTLLLAAVIITENPFIATVAGILLFGSFINDVFERLQLMRLEQERGKDVSKT